MPDELMTEEQAADWRVQVMVTGAVIGALVGLGAAFVYIRQVEEAGGDRPKVGVGETLGLGLGLLGLVNQIGSLGKPKKKGR